MLEALVAIGLAGNVVQFVQYAGELISQVKAIRSGSTKDLDLPGVRKLGESLTKQAGIIQSHLRGESTGQPSPDQAADVECHRSPEDQHLLDVAIDCQIAGNDFVIYLDTLVDPKASSNILRSLQLGVKIKWKQHIIEGFASKLDKFRSALSLATILALRSKADVHNRTILGHLEGLKADSQGQATQSAESAKALEELFSIIQSLSGPRLDDIQFKIEDCLSKLDTLRKDLPRTREDAIMRWLNFRQMSWRYEEVPLAYLRTFQWIFQRPREDLWDDFSAHLIHEDVTVPYWINGKAGSGKSTLMKYIVDDPRTMDALRKWAGTEQLLVVNFFFWNLGTILQKSNVGMLRALIYSVLEKYPELLPSVFPNLYRNWEDSGRNADADREPSYIEIKMAFGLLIEKASRFLKLCIFVDGIDEFEGDHKDISMFLSSLASKRIKMIVSSRPISGCVSAFRGYPTLRLQDLTQEDMELFVRGNLSSHRAMLILTKRFPRQANEIVTEIMTKAAGVFLWVKIVVRLLVDGLEDGDDISDLQKKLRQLPPDLRDLYRRMIEKMHPDHQIQAAEIFQLFHIWNLSIIDKPLRTLTLSFAMQSPTDAFDREVMPLAQETLEWLCQNTEARVRSRCCGLLEVHKKAKRRMQNGHSAGETPYTVSDIDVSSTIDYLHRTVAEFLVSDDVWKDMCEMTSSSKFDPRLSLTCACLSHLKTDCKYKEPSTLLHIHNAITICRGADSISDRDLGQIVSNIESTMITHRVINSRMAKGHLTTLHWITDFYPVPTVPLIQQEQFRKFGSINHLAARLALCQYLKAFCNFRAMSYLARYCLVLHAITSWGDSSLDIPLHDRSHMLLFLLHKAAKPEDLGLDSSLWRSAVLVCKQLLDQGEHVEAAELLRIFLSTAKTRRSLIMTMIYNDKDEMVNPATIIYNVKAANDKLGSELEEFAFSKGPVYELSKYFRDTVAAVSSTNRSPRRDQDEPEDASLQKYVPNYLQNRRLSPPLHVSPVEPHPQRRGNNMDQWPEKPWVNNSASKPGWYTHNRVPPAASPLPFMYPPGVPNDHTFAFNQTPSLYTNDVYTQLPRQEQHSYADFQYGVPFRPSTTINTLSRTAAPLSSPATYTNMNHNGIPGLDSYNCVPHMPQPGNMPWQRNTPKNPFHQPQWAPPPVWPAQQSSAWPLPNVPNRMWHSNNFTTQPSVRQTPIPAMIPKPNQHFQQHSPYEEQGTSEKAFEWQLSPS